MILENCISREAIKRKLQEHHDFFINAYGGFSNMPQNDKSRVDEINNCIAMVVNEPSIEPKEKTGWIPINERLPEEFESVLVCYESQGGMAQAVSERFGTHTGYRWSALAGIEPIAWMPLPEPFKAESETKE